MRSLRLCIPALSLFFAACGGIAVDGSLSDPRDDDAGSAEHDSGTASADAGQTPPTPVTPVGPSCSQNSDCAEGLECAYPTDEDGCATFVSTGVCVRPILSACQAIEGLTGCGCNNQNVYWTTGCSGYPSGYAPAPLLYKGACTEGGPIDAGAPTSDASSPVDDASSADASGTILCSADDDCPTGDQCGYLIDQGCGATRQCFPGGDWGLCDSIEAACACSGQTVALSGCAQAASQPIAMYPGTCPGSDGGF